MANIDCYSARALNIVLGILLLAMGLFFLVGSVTILPVIGFFLSIPTIAVSVYFFFAPRDRACFLS